MVYRPGMGQLAARPPIIETLFENKSVKIDRITAKGQISAPGDFPVEPSYEFIQLLKGKLVLQYKGKSNKVTLEPGDHSVKSPKDRTRADFTSLDEETVWLKISFQGARGKYPAFTGAVGVEEAHSSGEAKTTAKKVRAKRKASPK